ncbi:MAG: DUF1385 domain-containing protein [Clostridia bacterium]|nr:DUF1385 domain-containing protein [Clostridia bacterium]
MKKKESQQVVHKTTIGGQSILEGIMMKGPRKTCTVIRKPDNSLAVKEETTTPLKEKYPIAGIPVIRGFVMMVQSLKEGFQAIEYSSQFLGEEEEKPSKLEQWLIDKIGEGVMESVLYFISVVLGVGLAVGLFILLPAFLISFLPQSVPHLGANLIEGILRIIIFILYMVIMGLIPDMKRTFRYHGAEHKTIYCYEKGLELTTENVRIQPREHPRCGTSFLFVIMIISILVFSVVTADSRIVQLLLRIVLLPIVIGLSYEVNRFAGRHDGAFSSILRWPGMMLQHITVLEPDDSMIEVAIVSLQHVIPEDKQEDKW